MASNGESDLNVSAKLMEGINNLNVKLQEKTDDLKHMEELVHIVITKERLSNDQLQEARKALISVVLKVQSKSRVAQNIGIKMMGELDPDIFVNECEVRLLEEPRVRAAELWVTWEGMFADPKWYPFKVINTSDGNIRKEIDESDRELAKLKEEWGEELYKTVTTALIELEEYNPIGRHAVPELWNFEENRKASLKEVNEFLESNLYPSKRKRKVSRRKKKVAN